MKNNNKNLHRICVRKVKSVISCLEKKKKIIIKTILILPVNVAYVVCETITFSLLTLKFDWLTCTATQVKTN